MQNFRDYVQKRDLQEGWKSKTLGALGGAALGGLTGAGIGALGSTTGVLPVGVGSGAIIGAVPGMINGAIDGWEAGGKLGDRSRSRGGRGRGKGKNAKLESNDAEDRLQTAIDDSKKRFVSPSEGESSPYHSWSMKRSMKRSMKKR